MSDETIVNLIGSDYESKLLPLGGKYAKERSLLTNKRQARKFLKEPLFDLIDNSKLPRDSIDADDEKNRLLLEVIAYFDESIKTKKIVPVATRTTKDALRSALTNLFNNIPHLRYDGKKLNYDDLEEGFDRNLVEIPEDKILRPNTKTKRINATALKRDADTIFNSMKDVPEKIKSTVYGVIKEIKSIQRNYGKEKKIKTSDLEFSITDVSLLKVFSTQSLNEFENREKTYKHWEKVHSNLDKLDEEIKTLVVLLEELKSDDVDVKAFIKAVSEEGFTVNYIEDFDLQKIELSDIDDRAIDFLELFMLQNNFLSKTLDVGFDTLGQVINTEQGAIRIREADEELVEDTLSDAEADAANQSATGFYGEVMENLKPKYDMDALAILHFERNLSKLAVVGNEDIDGLIQTLQEFFEEMKTEFNSDDSTDVVLDDKLEDAMENFIQEIETLDDYKGGNTYLPIFMVMEDELQEYYNLDFTDVKEHINEFLLTFKNITEGGEKSQGGIKPDTSQLQGLGAGKLEKPKEGTQLFRFNRYLQGKQGTQRELRNIAKDMKEKIYKQLDIISELILDNMSNQLYNEHLLGTDLPFRDNIALRSISIRDFNSDEPKKFSMFREVNKALMLNQEAFITKEQINDFNSFLGLLSKGDTISNFTQIENKAKNFYDAIDDIVENKEISKRAKNEIASILGSIWKYSNKGDKKFMGVSILSAYNKVFADEISEINTLQVISDTIRQNKDMFSDMEVEIRDLLNNLDRVSKSEINKKLLEAHDVLRILKSKPVIHSMKNENSYDDMENMITKMETDFNIDMSASEIIGVVKAVDSFEGIAKEYGIDAEHVYVLKANFR